jgi:carboxyl-terminal processing protease
VLRRSLCCGVVLALIGCGGGAPVKAPTVAPVAVETAPAPPVVAPMAPAVVEPPVPPERQADVASFDQVWTTIRDRHFEPTLGGLDWDAVRAELRPKVIAAADRRAVRLVLEDLIGRLHLTHFAILPLGPDDEVPAAGGPAGTVGLDLRPHDGGLVVTAVDAGGPAAKAGVKPGWMLTRVGERALADVLAPMRTAHAGSSLLGYEEVAAAQGALAGPLAETTAAEFVDGKGKPRAVRLGHAQPPGTPAQFGHLPPIPVVYEARRVGKGGSVGYVRLSVFFDPARIMPAFAKDVAELAGARGLVLDLRGNPGGIGGMAMGMSGYLVTAPANLGVMKSRTSELKFVVNPQPSAWTGPVAVLVDELSASTSEILAAGLQDLGRARVFGRRTPGAALPSQIEKLPNGDGFQYAVATYVSSGGRTLEGQGVVPDQVIALDRRALLAGHDPVIDAALAWIATQPREESR